MNDTIARQLRVIGASFVVATVLACGLALKRPLFEAWIKEAYRPLEPELQALVAELSRSEQAVKTVAALEPERRDALYDQWMQLTAPPPVAARMVRADPDRFLGRAERTLVVGSAEQRDRAISFLVQSESELALLALRRALAWFDRRRDPRSRDAVARALGQLEAPTRRRP